MKSQSGHREGLSILAMNNVMPLQASADLVLKTSFYEENGLAICAFTGQLNMVPGKSNRFTDDIEALGTEQG